MTKTRILTIALAIMMLFGSACAQAQAAEEKADIVFVGGTIYTVDEADTMATALAVKDGKILFVGDDETALTFAGEETVVNKLEGKFMMPGLIDAHIHSILPTFFAFNLTDCTTLEETMDIIKTYVDAHPEQPSYFGFGYNVSFFEGIEKDKGPRKERLDDICPDKPIAILAYAGHELWANSVFLNKHGFNAQSESPRGGTIEKDEATGELWGTLKDTAMKITEDDLYNQDTLLRELPTMVSLFNSLGFTSVLSVSAYDIMPVPFAAYKKLEENGQLTLKVHGATALVEANYDENVQRAIETREKYNTELIKMNTVKVFLDGAMDTRTAFLLEPYEGTPDNYGQAAWEQEKMNDAFAKMNANGIQIHAHAIGDGSVRMTLDAFEYAKAQNPTVDCRNVMTHLQLVSEEDKPRFGELGICAVTQPAWQYRVYGFTDDAEGTAVGEERVNAFYPLKSLKDNGAVIAASSDFPFTSDPNPFVAMEVGVTRNMPKGAEDQLRYNLPPITDMDDPKQLLAPQERLSIQEMIRAYTINAAYTLFSEKETGSLEVGKAADLVIVDQNLLEIDPLLISQTKVLQTYLNGALVFDAK